MAASTVRWSSSGAEPRPSEKGTTIGSAVCTPAMSPITIAASNGPCRPNAEGSAASRAAPASPPLPPLVETSTIVRLVSRVENTLASSSSAAVADSSAVEPRAAASRCAKIRIGAALVEPGRCATTVLSERSPATVCPSKR